MPDASEIVPAGETAPAAPLIDPKTGRPLGMEDIEEGDLAIPRFNIVQKEAVFQDSLTNEKFSEMTVILLAAIKQRVLWPAEVDDANRPLCKSYDFHTGIANEKDYPWQASGFKREDYDETDPKLPCKACKLKEWDSHPTRGTPWCAEQWVFPLVTEAGGTALVTFQRSGLKAAKSYASGFIDRGTNLFTARTRLSLSAQRRGNVDFAVPIFEKVGDVDPAEYMRLGAMLQSISAFLRTPRSFAEESPTPAAPVANESDDTYKGEIPF